MGFRTFPPFSSMQDSVAKELVDNWCNSHGGSLKSPPVFVQKLLDKDFTYNQVAEILGIMDVVCNECWDSEYPCTCWRDE
jgi:hypothetical protein